MLIGLKGRMGTGKTVSTVFLGKGVLETTLIDTVVSNFRTNMTDIYVDNPKELEETSEQLKHKNVRVLYLLDEIWAWMDSRDSNTNDIMETFVINSRKRGVFGIWNAQKFHMVDRRLRELSDYYGLCNHIPKYDSGKETDMAKIILFKVFEENLIHHNTIAYNPEHFYGVYDTEEEIQSENKSDMYSDMMDDLKERCKSGEFKTKSELDSYLNLNTELSQNDAEAMTHEIFRQIANESKEDAQKSLGDASD